jgi:phage terminase large subunit-like protein
MIEDAWGWRRYEDGTRLYRDIFEAIGRKNGKTTVAAGIGNMLAIGDGEPGAEVYAAAASKEQAESCWREAWRMVGQSPELSRECEMLAGSIYCPALMSFFKPLAAKAGTKHGLNIYGLIEDELHEWPNRELHDTLITAMGARREPLRFSITTAGANLESLCWQEWDYALKVRDGLQDDRSLLPIIFAADPADDPADPATWRKANPNMGVSIKEAYLREKYEKALAQPGAFNAFKRLHLNIWTEAHDKLWSLAVWNDPANASPFHEDSLIGRPCYLGLDLAWKHDLSALPLVFPPHGDDPCWHVVCRFFLPEAGISERVKRDRVPYDVWAANGLLTLTSGDVTDFNVIEAEVRAIWKKFSPRQLGFDRFMAGGIINNLTETNIECVGVGQGFVSTALPMAELDRAIHARQFRHGGNPILAWMASNVVAATDPAGNMKPDKQRSIQRIDGIPATLNAMALALAAKADAPSPYEHRGLIILR